MLRHGEEDSTTVMYSYGIMKARTESLEREGEEGNGLEWIGMGNEAPPPPLPRLMKHTIVCILLVPTPSLIHSPLTSQPAFFASARIYMLSNVTKSSTISSERVLKKQNTATDDGY